VFHKQLIKRISLADFVVACIDR